MKPEPGNLSVVLRQWSELFMHRSFIDLRRFMEESGLSPSQTGTLMWLYHCQECGVSDIGQHLGITKAAASQLVDRLVQQGLLVRAEAPNDRRFKTVSLTSQGRALVEKSIEARRKWLAELTTSLPEEEQQRISGGLVLLIDAARKLEEIGA